MEIELLGFQWHTLLSGVLYWSKVEVSAVFSASFITLSFEIVSTFDDSPLGRRSLATGYLKVFMRYVSR